jgi:hypothetical protein
MDDIATGLYTLVSSSATLQTLTGKTDPVVFEHAEHDEDYPYVSYSLVSGTPRILHSPQGAMQFTVWDFKVWSENALDVLKIHEELIRIFDSETLNVGRVGALMPGRTHSIVSELNKAENIIYSQNIECEIFIR